tara:strand:- start:4698 stop:5117 length:420 start_codon:yes stop_codon:yes gene_type:complete
MKYKFLDHTADVLFEAYGKTLEELFINAALAVQEIQVDIRTVKPKITKKISLKESKLDLLLFEFLQELIFLKDSEQLFFSNFKVKITKNRKYSLEATCKGERLNLERHKLGVDTKAITFHEFELKELKSGYKARVIVDI